MKRLSIKLFIATLCLFACSTRGAFAQDGNSFYIGYGVATANSIDDALADIVITGVTGGTYNVANSKYTGAVFAGYRGYIAERLELGGTFVYEHASKDILIESAKAGSISTKTYAILAELKYNYINKEKFRLYSGAAAGLAHSRISAEDNVDTEKSKTNDFAYQVDGIGVSYGDAFSISINAGYGYKGIISAVLAYGF